MAYNDPEPRAIAPNTPGNDAEYGTFFRSQPTFAETGPELHFPMTGGVRVPRHLWRD